MSKDYLRAENAYGTLVARSALRSPVETALEDTWQNLSNCTPGLGRRQLAPSKTECPYENRVVEGVVSITLSYLVSAEWFLVLQHCSIELQTKVREYLTITEKGVLLTESAY